MIPTLLSLLITTALPAGTILSVDGNASLVTYHVTHKLHRVQGESKSIEGKAVVKDGQVLTMVRVPVASFRSGDGNRDEHMQETLDVGKFPYVVWRGAAALEHDNTFPAGKVTMTGKLEFHGVSRDLTVPIEVESGSDGTVHIRGTLSVSLDEFRVERPSLLFVKIDDTCLVDLDFLLKAAQQ